MVRCKICGRELTNEKSVTKGIGPVCSGKIKESILNGESNKARYKYELLAEYNIIIIHEIVYPDEPRISLTNSIELVVGEIVKLEEICPNDWAFVQHSNDRNLFGGYDEYDLVSFNGFTSWKYVWHSDATSEEEEFSQELLVSRVEKMQAQ
jgi:hypothetical protein